MEKRLLALVLVLVLCLGLAAPAVAAGSDFYIRDGVLFGVHGNPSDVVIPDGVTAIAGGAFSYRDLTSVTIPDGVTEIGFLAFSDCAGLTSVTIPASVTEIGSLAFRGCPDLTIYGVVGSYAETYAQANNIPFAASQATVAEPDAPAAPAVFTAYPSTQVVDVDGTGIEFQCYALKDANGYDTNYIKLRDLASVLNNTAARFEVGWNGDVTITTGWLYTPNGFEMSTPFQDQRTCERSAVTTLVNGVAADLDAILLTDDNGGGHTYYKLRDLGAAIGFNVDWSAGRGIYIETE